MHARWLRRGAPLLYVLLAGGGIPGPVVLGAVYLTGGSYLAYSLTDRIDARDLKVANLVEGVVPLVERAR